MIFLSIIIPVYNSEKFLSKCLDSCLDQTFDKTQFEVIAVDDGSADNSWQILKEYEKKETNFKVFAQTNQKQGAARNNGLRYSVGKYIWFVDSDDWIEPCSIEKLYNFTKDEKFEIIRFDAKNFYNGTYQDRNCEHKPFLNFKGHQILIENKFSTSFPTHLFLRDFLIKNRLFFKEKIYFEDNELMVRILDKSNSFIYLNEHLYTVTIREDSTTRTENYARFRDLLKVIEEQINYLESKNTNDEITKAISIQISRNMNTSLVKVLNSKIDFLMTVSMLRSNLKLSQYIFRSKSRFHILQFLLLPFPNLLMGFMKFYYKN